jgi:putative hemolysin
LIEAVKVATPARLAEYGNGTGEPEWSISTEEKMKIQWIIVALFLTAAGMTSVAAADIIAGSDGQGMIIGMPDPSAVWAGNMGYGYAVRTDDQGGQHGVIILPDGTERDAWEAYREYLAQQEEEGEAGPMIGMPNPSAMWADEMGYQYVIRTDDQGGQYGVIILPDGTERDAWEAYREYLIIQNDGSGQINPGGPVIGMPDPSAVWSSQMGYRYVIRTDDQGNQYGVIAYPDGTERDSWSAFRENGALSRLRNENPAASLPGIVPSSRQSLLEHLLTK